MKLEAVKVFGDSITITVGVCKFVTLSCGVIIGDSVTVTVGCGMKLEPVKVL
jgi:hypothetical protein